MQYDGTINIASGLAADSKVWKNKEWDWSELVDKLKVATKTNETYKDYQIASKAEKGKIKDVGGYVGAYLRSGRRKQGNVVSKQLITLDIDYAHINFWQDFTMQFENAAVLHSTHSHTTKNPRYRLIMPISREVTPDEYVAISRKIAGILNIELFDNTTFETHRLMFWPSVCKDIDYYVEFQDGPWIDADQVLAMYKDWTDTSLWPTAKRQLDDVGNLSKKQEDPEQKKGMVGAFCRAYSIQSAIETFLKDEYLEADQGRYTYTKGSTAAGLIIYEDKFAFSHHGTDPCSGKLCNSFDLVRIHLFGHLDEATKQKTDKQSSFKSMEDLCMKDKNVRRIIAEEKLQNAKYDFSEDLENEDEKGEQDSDFNDVENEPIDLEWATELEVDNRGKYLSTATNVNLILSQDPRLKGAFKLNTFDFKRYIFKSVPWRKIKRPEPMRNVDYSGVRNYIETVYGIAGSLKIDDSLALELERNCFHPVMDYLNSLKWDQVSRVDKILIEYLGAEDNAYTREALKKTLVGAVARIYNPGTKFDLVLTLVGDQGTGKSTLAKVLGKEWYSDSFVTVKGNQSFEQLQGAWVIEMAELAGLRKAEVEAVKHYISKQEDTFRPAYAHTTETFKRQCVFIGTTNNKDFLTDASGNRRFMPIDVGLFYVEKSIWDISPGEVDLIWAEAKYLYENGEKLYLENEAATIAKVEQKKHGVYDERTGIVEAYLDRKLPKNWDSFDAQMRLNYFTDDLSSKGVVERDYVCIAELWCECLGLDLKNMDRYKTRDLHDIMKSLENWERSESTKNFSIYGKQKFYQRKLT